MPKVITAPHGDTLQGSGEKRLDIAPDGTEWLCLVTPYKIVFFRDRGAGPVYASDSDLDIGQDTAVPSFFIDAAGIAWVSWCQWNKDPQIIRVARGRPTGTGWKWTVISLSPGGRVGVDTDIFAMQVGAGSGTFVGWTSPDGAYVARINVKSDGSMAVSSLRFGPASGLKPNGGLVQSAVLEFAHTGDGKTPSAAPHIFLAAADGTSGALYLSRARWESAGTWSWENAVLVSSSVRQVSTATCMVYDGDRLMVAYTPAPGTSIAVAEWTGTGAVTARNPPAMPNGTGVVVATSLAHDPATDDIYLLAYGADDGDILVSKFTRSNTSWSAWSVVVVRDPSGADGKVNALRHPPRDSVDFAWAKKVSAGWEIYTQQLAALVRTPNAPVPLDPPQGAVRDLAKGYTFRWRYQPVSPGDVEAAWAFRRTLGSTTEYWNAGSQAWQSTIVWNATDPNARSQAPFAPGKWVNPNTYVWAVATRSTTNATSVFSTNRTVVSSTAPAVTVIEPNGLVFGTTTPRVSWQVVSSEPQRDYQVRITQDIAGLDPSDPGGTVVGNNGLVWSSGTVTSALARSIFVGINLSGGIGYRAWVRVTNASGVASGWVSAPFSININPPAGPLAELVDEVAYGTEVPRVRLDLLARSNFMGTDQAVGQAGWVARDNTTVTSQEANTSSQVEDGMMLTSGAAGAMGVISELGSPPPAASPNLPAPLGPRFFPVIPGQVYTAMAHGKTGTDVVRAARVSIQWYSDDTAADGATPTAASYAGATSGDQFNIGNGPYTQMYLVARAPASARLGRVVVEVLNTAAAGEVVYLARLAVHPGANTAWQPGGYSGAQVLMVERSDDGGGSWRTVAARVKPDLYQRATLRDRSMPLGRRALYRVRTLVDLATISGYAGASTLRSDPSPLAAITLQGSVWVIRDLLDDSADGEVLAYVTEHKRSDSEEVAVHRPAGRTYPVMDYEGQHGAEGSLKIYVSAGRREVTTDLLTRGTPLLVQSPIGEQLLLRTPKRDYETYGVGAREISVDYVEVGLA